MGLAEVIDVRSRQEPGPQGELQTVFDVVFTTEATSGTHEITIPGEDFTSDLARERAAAEAAEIDAAVEGADDE